MAENGTPSGKSDKTESAAASSSSTSLCPICSQPGTKMCAGCMSISYCSQEHQKEHWKVHSEQCKPFVVKTNQKYGRYVAATRNIPPGTIIMNEPALTFGPKTNARPLCLGCHKLLLTAVEKADTVQYTCSKCLFPMCGPDCSKIQIHAENECKIFERYNLPFPKIKNFAIHHPIYECILPVRCLMLKLNATKKWKKLTAMMHHNEIRSAAGDVWYMNDVNIVRLLLDHCGMSKDFNEVDIHSVIGYIDVNAFEMIVNGNEVAGLFYNTYLMSHECVSNTHHTFTPDCPDLRMVVRASVPIAAGEQIKCLYTNILEGTADRLQFLKASKYFECTCKRCEDPTELGTHFSSIKCQNPICISKYLVPLNPLNTTSNWHCEGCLSEIPHATIQRIVEPIKDVLRKREKNFSHKDIVKKLELILKKYSTILHPNHYFMVQVTHVLCDLYGKDGRKVKQNEWKRKEELCRHFLEVLNVLAPGMSRLRGLTLYSLQASIYAQISNELENQNSHQNSKLKERLNEVTRLLEESYMILSLDPLKSKEGQIAGTMPKMLEEVREMMQKIPAN